MDKFHTSEVLWSMRFYCVVENQAYFKAYEKLDYRSDSVEIIYVSECEYQAPDSNLLIIRREEKSESIWQKRKFKVAEAL